MNNNDEIDAALINSPTIAIDDVQIKIVNEHWPKIKKIQPINEVSVKFSPQKALEYSQEIQRRAAAIREGKSISLTREDIEKTRLIMEQLTQPPTFLKKVQMVWAKVVGMIQDMCDLIYWKCIIYLVRGKKK